MYKKYIKRILDIIFSIIALPILGFITVVVAPIIKYCDHGTVFYNAPRIGYKGKVFTMYKFRSMSVNAPDLRHADGTTFNCEDDPRQTKIGKLLRKTSIDETPQIINILKGDMSFIGPRPDLPDAINIYIGSEKEKLSVRPGITGYSQAYYRNAIELHDRFKQDLFYAKNVTLMFDVKIIFKTISTVFLKRGLFRDSSTNISEGVKTDYIIQESTKSNESN